MFVFFLVAIETLSKVLSFRIKSIDAGQVERIMNINWLKTKVKLFNANRSGLRTLCFIVNLIGYGPI